MPARSCRDRKSLFRVRELTSPMIFYLFAKDLHRTHGVTPVRMGPTGAFVDEKSVKHICIGIPMLGKFCTHA